MTTAFTLTIIGSGTLSPDPQRSCSSNLLRFAEQVMLIDIGFGTMRRLAEEGIAPGSITDLLITHFHPDHISDLVPLLFTRLHHQPDAPRLRVYGPLGLQSFLRGMVSAYGDWLNEVVDSTAQLQEIRPGSYPLGNCTLRAMAVKHAPESLGYRLSHRGAELAFSGDSGYCPALPELCRNADLAVIECGMPAGAEGGNHLTAAEVARIAVQSNIRRLLINHIYPAVMAENPLDIIRRQFSGEVALAEDGLSIVLESRV